MIEMRYMRSLAMCCLGFRLSARQRHLVAKLGWPLEDEIYVDDIDEIHEIHEITGHVLFRLSVICKAAPLSGQSWLAFGG